MIRETKIKSICKFVTFFLFLSAYPGSYRYYYEINHKIEFNYIKVVYIYQLAQ